jgi:Enoyl-(Acyl carrier protein) reductase
VSAVPPRNLTGGGGVSAITAVSDDAAEALEWNRHQVAFGGRLPREQGRGREHGAQRRPARAGGRVNSVHPGFVATDMTEQYDQVVIEQRGRTAGDLSTSATPMGRRATPDEISYVVRFLASDEASFVTCASIIVNGRLTAQ